MLFELEVRCQVYERGHTSSELHVRIKYVQFYAGRRLWANECDAIGKNENISFRATSDAAQT